MDFNPTMTTLLARDTEEKIDKLKKQAETKIKNGEFATKDDLKAWFKSAFSGNAIDDEKLKYVGLAFSFDEGSAYLETGLDAYCTHLADINFKKQEKKEDEKPKAPYFIQFDKEVLKTFKTKEAIKNYASYCINQAIAESGNKEGNPEKLLNNLVSNYQNVNVAYGIQLSADSTLKDALTDCLAVSQKELLAQEAAQNPRKRGEILSADLQNLIEENDRNNPELKPLIHEVQHSPNTEEKDNQKNLNELTTEKKLEKPKKEEEESSVDMSQVGEGTGDVNYFVGYDKEKVGRLFEGRPAVFSVFKEFVEKYNKLMNVLLSHELSPEDVKDLRNDIDPYFQKLSAACSGIGGDGSLIQNLCDGMLTVLGETFNAELEGRDINGLKLKNSLQGNKAFDHTDNDGLRNEAAYSVAKPAANQTAKGAVSSLVGYGDLADPENLQIMDTYGIDRDDIIGNQDPMKEWMNFLERELPMLEGMGMTLRGPGTPIS